MSLLLLQTLAPDTAREITTASQALAIVANIIKILEALVIGFGAFQLWVNRGERRAAERTAAQLARKAANYQAWQVVNGAHGKGGSGGRVDALQDLVANDVSLAGVQLDGAWLERLVIPHALLRQASLRGAKLLGADLSGCNLEQADLSGAGLDGANLRGAFLRGADLAGATLATADLRGADLAGVRGWQAIASISYAHLEGIRNAPDGFLAWAVERGAIAVEGADLREPVAQGFSTEWRSI